MSTNLPLRQFCKQHDLAPSTVHRVAKQMGISLSEGVDEVSSDRLLTYFGISPISPAPKTEEAGGAIAVPGFSSLDLQGWGVVQSSFDIDDPVALANQAIEALDVIDRALDSHVAQLDARKQQTLSAAEKLKAKRQAVQTKALKTELRTEFITAQIAAGEQSLRQDVDALGKSSAA